MNKSNKLSIHSKTHGKDNNFFLKAKNRMVIRVIEIKKEGKIFKKRHMNEEKDIASMDFAEYLRKPGVSEDSKVYKWKVLLY